MVMVIAPDRAASIEAPTCLVVADHQLCGQAVGGLLSEQFGWELVAVCHSVAEALSLMKHDSPPALLLLDVFGAGEHWQDAAIALHELNPDARLIMFTAPGEKLAPPAQIIPILLGVVEKSRPWDDLLELVSRWQQQHPSPYQRRLANALVQLDRLSPRERVVFHSVGKGMQSKEIAKQMNLCVNTVETYRKTISGKLGLSGVELVRVAVLHRCTNPARFFATKPGGKLLDSK
jgi:two-component system nitrate/nitrite response regulator NarL